MNDGELKKQLQKEMLGLCETNSSVMTYMECLMRKYERLQFNWNSLRECIIGVIEGAREELNIIMQGDNLEYINKCSLQFEAIRKNLEIVLDKMNELEGDNNGIMD